MAAGFSPDWAVVVAESSLGRAEHGDRLAGGQLGTAGEVVVVAVAVDAVAAMPALRARATAKWSSTWRRGSNTSASPVSSEPTK
jgi:hypothetical protein